MRRAGPSSDFVYDSIATAVPFLSAGASAGLGALRASNTAVNSAQVAMDVARVANVANDAARAVNTTGRATDIGRAVHNQVGDAVNLSSSANNFFKGANGATGIQPDLSWGKPPGWGVWADLTTQGQWGQHVTKYGSSFGEGIPLIYEAGKGLDAFKLYSGAGTGLTSLQFGVNSFSGQSSAGGGFLLYPNKSNTNMMQSVYSK